MKKNILLLVFSIFFVCTLQAQKKGVATKESVFFYDDLESGNLDNFKVINGGDTNAFMIDETGGHLSPRCITLKYSATEAHDDWLILPQIPVEEGTIFSFWHENSILYPDMFDIVLSTTGNNPADFTEELKMNVKPLGEYKEEVIDLSAYAGQSVYVALHSTSINGYWPTFDEFKVTMQGVEHDLAVKSITAPKIININESFAPIVTIENPGTNSENNFTISLKIKNKNDNSVLYNETLDGGNINASSARTYNFPNVTISESEKDIAYEAVVIFADDLVNTNDTLTQDAFIRNLKKWAYGYVSEADDANLHKGIVLFKPEEPQTRPIPLLDASEINNDHFNAGTNYNGSWCVATDGHMLYLADYDEFNVEALDGVVDFTRYIADMTYDYTSNKIYVSMVDWGNSPNLVGKFAELIVDEGSFLIYNQNWGGHNNNSDALFLTLSCDLYGNMYTISEKGILYSVDKFTGNTTQIKKLDVDNVSLQQSAEFNHYDNLLYWTQYSKNGTANNYSINPQTGIVKNLGPRFGRSEITAMAYDYLNMAQHTTFVVKNGGSPIQGAVVEVNNRSFVTNSNGKIDVLLPDNQYAYTVRSEGYNNYYDTVTVADYAQTVNINLTNGAPKWPVYFVVKDINGVVENATITIGDTTITTDENGQAMIEHESGNNVSFTIEEEFHVPYSGTTNISNQTNIVDVQMTLVRYDLSFVIKEKNGSQSLIANADIKVFADENTWSTQTNSNGECNFEQLLKQKYKYQVLAKDYVIVIDSVYLDGDKTLTIELDENIVAPFRLKVLQQPDSSSAILSWNGLANYVEDFESYEDFALEWGDWTLHDEDGMQNYVFNDFIFPNNGTPTAGIIFNPALVDQLVLDESPAHSGNKYCAVFNPNSQALPAPVAADDWIISPKIMVSENDKISFWGKAGQPDFVAEKFQVFISATDTEIPSFESVSEIITCSGIDWRKYTIEIPEKYANREIYVGIHVTSLDQFYFCLDDFEIGAAQKNRQVESYTVFLDNELKAENITETNFTLTNLEFGKTYTAGVKAKYANGESSISEITFEMLLEHTVNFIVLNANDTGAPLSDVTISVDGQALPANSYSISLLNGTHNYLAQKEGFKETAGTFIVEGGDTQVVIRMSEIISINDVEGKISIGPNPTEGILQINAVGNYQLMITDVYGRNILSRKLNDNTQIDLSNEKSGIYFITLSSDSKSKTFKIIKK